MRINTPYGEIESNDGMDLSIPIGNNSKKVKAWYVDEPIIEPVTSDSFIGSVEKGAPVNFRNVFFNPHGHGTHTETVGHISKKIYSINEVAIPLFMKAILLTVEPKAIKSSSGEIDHLVEWSSFEPIQKELESAEAIILRVHMNAPKINVDFSSTNPPYLDKEIAVKLREIGIKHLLIDLPSVDKEMGEGVLAFHHAFWDFPNQVDLSRTITELIHVPEEIEDGTYLLNLSVAPFENDASPSRPVIYKIWDK